MSVDTTIKNLLEATINGIKLNQDLLNKIKLFQEKMCYNIYNNREIYNSLFMEFYKLNMADIVSDFVGQDGIEYVAFNGRAYRTFNTDIENLPKSIKQEIKNRAIQLKKGDYKLFGEPTYKIYDDLSMLSLDRSSPIKIITIEDKIANLENNIKKYTESVYDILKSLASSGTLTLQLYECTNEVTISDIDNSNINAKIMQIMKCG